MNLVMGDVEETRLVQPTEPEFGSLKRVSRKKEMMFIRGDSIILASPI